MKKIKLTQNKYALVDDADFEWLNQWRWIAEKVGHNWYASRGGGKRGVKRIRMHRFIMKFPKELIDHRDKDGLNNQRSNLRLANKSINAINSKVPSDNKSGYKGVFWHKNFQVWHAYLTFNSKKIHLGTFLLIRDAINARKKAEIKYYGN